MKLDRYKQIVLMVLFWGICYNTLDAQNSQQPIDSTNVKVKIMEVDRIIPNTAFKQGEWLKFVIRYGPVKAGFAYMEIPEIVEINNKAKNDIIEAYNLLRSTIMEQLTIYLEASEQLDAAASAGSSTPNVLKGITENQTVIDTIATAVLNRTNDESRANAARELLKHADEI